MEEEKTINKRKFLQLWQRVHHQSCPRLGIHCVENLVEVTSRRTSRLRIIQRKARYLVRLTFHPVSMIHFHIGRYHNDMRTLLASLSVFGTYDELPNGFLASPPLESPSLRIRFTFIISLVFSLVHDPRSKLIVI